MSTLIVGALAVVVTASVTLPVGWWLGGRRKASELRTYRTVLKQCQTVFEQRQHQHAAVVGRVINASLNALRAEKRHS